MRRFLALLPVLSLATAAFAHGSHYRGYAPPPPVERGIPCDCGLAECDLCASPALREGRDVRVSSPRVTQVKRWGDVSRCRVEVTLESLPDRGMFEAYARVEPGPLFAAVAGSLRNGDETLSGDLKPSEEARRAYLYSRRLFNFDPMLILWRGPGRLDVRVYPLRKGVAATAVIEGYMIADVPMPCRVRVYRTEGRCLAIVPLEADERRAEAAFVDERGGRALHFLSDAQCRERYGSVATEEAPFVPALECALTGVGNRAASPETALVAIAVNSPQPPFVGPDRPLEGGTMVGLRDPSDPPPPPDPAIAPRVVPPQPPTIDAPATQPPR